MNEKYVWDEQYIPELTPSELLRSTIDRRSTKWKPIKLCNWVRESILSIAKQFLYIFFVHVELKWRVRQRL